MRQAPFLHAQSRTLCTGLASESPAQSTDFFMRPPLQKAFIWAAGLGTRLRPYTYETPKPMLPVLGRPLIEYVLRYLRHAGIREVTVNTWHLGEQFEALPEIARDLDLQLSLSRQPQRFEHAGDLAFAHTFLDSLAPDEVFVGLNGDTLFYLEPELLRKGAEQVGPEYPIGMFVHKTAANPLYADEDRVVSQIGDTVYCSANGQTERWDDFGIKLVHASIRDVLPVEPGTMAFHGSTGLLGQLARTDRFARCIPVDADRVEIGTVDDYEAHEQDRNVTHLVERILHLQ